MNVFQIRRAIDGLDDNANVDIHVWSAPFDDESVEFLDVTRDAARVVIRVQVIDDVTREIRGSTSSST